MSFTAWNTLLLEKFFSPVHEDQWVVLSADRELLNHWGAHLGGHAGLVAAVQTGPVWLAMNPYTVPEAIERIVHTRHLKRQTVERLQAAGTYHYRNPSGDEELAYLRDYVLAPAYLPYLVLAVAVYADASAFYDEFAEAVGMPEWTDGAQEKLEEAFFDLKDWSKLRKGHPVEPVRNRGTAGRFGKLLYSSLDHNVHMGRLRGQAIVKRSDKDGLHRLFWDHRAAPNQRISDELFADFKTDIGARDFSVGLRRAAARDEFNDVLRHRLESELAIWDGLRPGLQRRQRTTSTANCGPFSPNVGFVLQLNNGQLPWQLRLAVFPRPGLPLDDTPLTLRHDGKSWRGQGVWGREFAVLNPEQDHGFRLLTAASAAQKQPLKLDVVTDESVAPEDRLSGPFCLPHARARFFAVSSGALVEMPSLPLSGPGYIMLQRGQGQAADLQRIDEILRNDANVQVFTPAQQQGIPESFQLYCIPRCEAFPRDGDLAEKLDGVLGQNQSRSRISVLRFSGGTIRTKGVYGREYLSYDLPRLVVAGTNVDIEANGLALNERQAALTAGIPGHQASQKVYEIHRTNTAQHLFTITLYKANEGGEHGEVLESKHLRVSYGDFRAIADSKYGLSRYGETIALNGGNIRQQLQGFRAPSMLNAAHVMARSPRVKLKASIIGSGNGLGKQNPDWLQEFQRAVMCDEAIVQWPIIRFLDVVASREGTIPYGRARDLLQAYLLDAGDERTRVNWVLTDLQRRGCLEIVTDREGRRQAIGGIRPTIYQLEIMSPWKRAWTDTWGVAGTVNRIQWQRLASNALGFTDVYAIRTPEDFGVRLASGGASSLPALRFSGRCTHDVKARLTESAFELTGRASLQIATFCASISDMDAHFKQNPGYAPLEGMSREWFDPSTGEWGRVRPARATGRSWLGWRHRDPDSNRLVHWLRRVENDAESDRRVLDEEWVRWLSMTTSQHSDVSWSLSYCKADKTLWIPARMRLPRILERSLIAASGAPPMPHKLRRIAGDGAICAQTIDGRTLSGIAEHYSAMIPDHEPRWWLEYQAVSETFGALLCEKLHSKLVYIDIENPA